jgi:hypothetical protein
LGNFLEGVAIEDVLCFFRSIFLPFGILYGTFCGNLVFFPVWVNCISQPWF